MADERLEKGSGRLISLSIARYFCPAAMANKEWAGMVDDLAQTLPS